MNVNSLTISSQQLAKQDAERFLNNAMYKDANVGKELVDQYNIAVGCHEKALFFDHMLDKAAIETHHYKSVLTVKDWTTIFISSQMKDSYRYDTASSFETFLPRTLANIKYISLAQLVLPKNIYNITDSNNTLYYSYTDGTTPYLYVYKITIPPGFYTPSDIVTFLNANQVAATYQPMAFNPAGTPASAPVNSGAFNFSYDLLSNKIIVRCELDNSNSIYTILSSSHRKIRNKRVEFSGSGINVQLNQTINYPDGSSNVCDVVTIVTNTHSNLCDNSWFHISFVGGSGTVRTYSNMTNFITSFNQGVTGNSDITTHKLVLYFPVGSSHEWIFQPRTPDPVLSGSVENAVDFQNVCYNLGFTYSGPTNSKNKILDVITNGTNSVYVTESPHGLVNNSGNPYGGISVNSKLWIGNTLLATLPEFDIVPTATDNASKLIELVGNTSSLATKNDYIRNGYVSNDTVYIADECVHLTDSIDVFVKLAINSNNEVGRIQCDANQFAVYMGKIHYNYENTRFVFVDNVVTIGEEHFHCMISHAKKIKVSLHNLDATPLQFSPSQDWNLILHFGGDQNKL